MFRHRRTEQLGGVPFPEAVVDDLPDAEGPPPQLSPLRIGLALVLVTALGFGVWSWTRVTIASGSGGAIGATWFAPYVDATLTPADQFQNAASDPNRQVVLGFIVASPTSGCTPSWGGYYSIGQAEQTLQIGSRIAEMDGEGSGVIISFGGKSNSELATTCTNVGSLEGAYRSVIKQYGATTIDFDLEGATLNNSPSIIRRAEALARLQKSIRSSGGALAIWLTLPVSASGLTDQGEQVVADTLHAGVDLAGVNALAMDFGPPEPNMLATVEGSLASMHGQLAAVYARYGFSLGSRQLWNHEGVTVMIGENDDFGESFTTADADALAVFVRKNHLARVSLWSLNRDAPCGTEFPVLGTLSNDCSGTAQSNLEFDHIFSTAFNGTASSRASAVTASPKLGTVTTANDPFPTWLPAVPYPLGYKVVWQGDIYEAKWYNQGTNPSAGFDEQSANPWELIGPVLPTDHAPTTTTLPASADPSWKPSTAYPVGSKVLFSGLPYQAKWYNQGDSPGAEQDDPSGSPWNPLFSVPGEPSST
jgi:chitinase